MSKNEQIDKKLKGTATIYTDGAMEFVPQGTGSPRYETVSKVGSSAVYKTTGTGQQSYVAHLKVPADSADPQAELQEQLDKVGLKLWPMPRAEVPRGRVLLRQPGCLVTQNASRGELQVSFTINLKEKVDYLKEYYKLQNQINLCLHSNADSLRQLCRQLHSCSTKQ